MPSLLLPFLVVAASELGAPVQAPAGEAANPAPTAPLTNVAPTETQHDLSYRIGKDIRCPVCQGMSIAESPSTMAQDMMGRVRVMVKEGKSDADIRAYFVQRYGVWVLLDPPKEGFLLLVWLVPPVVLVGAALMALRHMRRLKQSRAAQPVQSAKAAPAPTRQPDATSSEPVPAAAAAPAANTAQAYLQAIRDEVQR